MESEKTLIIAEAGVNHNGSIEIAKRLACEAKKAGADIIKFQTFRANLVATSAAAKAAYQLVTTSGDESQLAMLKRLELSHEHHFILRDCCKELGIEFLSTAFDLESLHFLANTLKVGRLKIPSGEITNFPLLLAAARTGLPIILSTGMSNMEEIAATLRIISSDHVTLLQCTSNYPAPFCDINLRTIQTLKRTFGLKTGLSDHSTGISASLAAVALGATVIEKHFTLDRSMPGPDHKASLEPRELRMLVEEIRNVEAALGDGVKVCAPSEINTRDIVRKSLVALVDITPGEAFSEENLACMRPGTGIPASRYFDYLGKPAKRSYRKNELID
ncbi:MAG: N-acetylneuraminate synthase [Bdellovibrionales bacterium RIFOXYD1_FULL_53_11]|nr:MAG: N-acetylneuraminate synthase [Bdellovibrionales bacterium RIFOXYD1_FULL_53_11]